MKTANFYQLKTSKIDGAISIAVGKPKYVNITHEEKRLAPDWKLLNEYRNGIIDDKIYIEKFNKKLSGYNAKKCLDYLIKLTHPHEPVLMCHCNKKDFCHRHLVAEWLQKETGIEIQEMNLVTTTRVDGKIQETQEPSLF